MAVHVGWRPSLVDPLDVRLLPVDELLGLEPEGDLLVGALHSVRAVADVPAHLDAEVAADSAGLAVLGVGLAQHNAAGLDRRLALPYHGHHGTAGHVLDQAVEERLGREVGVVLLQVVLAGLGG